MPRIDPAAVPERHGSNYPAPFHQHAADRIKQALGRAGGLTDFGVNLTRLPPGAWSSQRHWHSHEDEFVYVIAGELTLLTDAGEQPLRAGDCAAFPKNLPDGHCLINRGGATAVYLEIGSCREAEDVCTYPDIDLHADARGYSHRDGTPYPD
ncbi:cupin domain-containing protein [Frateuria defendens]|uniref:cupin domain-containing protein n=1 Tax=Frateuria defendens TaxID=2219559 RepID=UPI00066FFDD5|nr:cupin domain-containing protein [Frateuria defendens]